MGWTIVVTSMGARDEYHSDKETLEEAMEEALVETGFGGNDEGDYKITATSDDE